MRPYPPFESPIVHRFVVNVLVNPATKNERLPRFPLLCLGAEPFAGPKVNDWMYPKGV